MSRYVDGFLIPIKKSAVEEYKKMASEAGQMWKEYGALQYVETVMEDASKSEWCGAFADYVKPAEDETIIFAFVVYSSRAHRDEVNKKLMADPRMSPEAMKNKPMPFDAMKMAYNGFEMIVDL
jgi:uncharacterized protein YbaA (DUF1428 family)